MGWVVAKLPWTSVRGAWVWFPAIMLRSVGLWVWIANMNSVKRTLDKALPYLPIGLVVLAVAWMVWVLLGGGVLGLLG